MIFLAEWAPEEQMGNKKEWKKVFQDFKKRKQ